MGVRADITADIAAVPTLPAVVIRLLEVVFDEDASVADLAVMVQRDQALGSRVLRIVNSAAFGLPRKVSSIFHATALLGLDELRRIALSVCVFHDLLGSKGCLGIDKPLYWQHNLAVAAASKALATDCGIEPNEAYAAGLLHDIGKVILAQYVEPAYGRVLRHIESELAVPLTAEQQLLGIDHAEVGGILARRWNLPDSLVAAIEHHHQPADAPPSLRPIASLAHLADYVAWTQAMGSLPLPRLPLLASGAEQHFDLQQLDTEAVIAAIDDEMDRSAAVFNLPTRGRLSFGRALTEANRELDLLGSQYEHGKRQLQDYLAKLRKHAIVDEQTSLSSRRKCLEVLDREIARSTRGGHPLAVAFVDLDHFKEINERLGCDAGDQVINDVAQLLRRTARPADLIVRYGGEQFATVLPETNLERAKQYGEQVRVAVESYERAKAGTDADYPISVSVGIAEHRPHQDRLTLLQHADRALHTAKRQGRNRVCCYGRAAGTDRFVHSA